MRLSLIVCRHSIFFRRGPEEERMDPKIRWAIGFTITMLAIGFKFWSANNRWNGGGYEASAKDIDAACAEMLSEDNHREAREWCRDSASAGFEMSKDEMLELAEEFYAAGAEKVYVTGIERMGNSNVAACMVVKLPGGGAARKAVLEAEAKLIRGEGEEPEKDVGQKYVLLGLD